MKAKMYVTDTAHLHSFLYKYGDRKRNTDKQYIPAILFIEKNKSQIRKKSE